MFHGDTAGQQEARTAMSEIMKADFAEAVPFQQLRKLWCNIENKTGIEELATLLTTFFEEGTRSAVEFLESDLVQDVKEVVGEVGLALENTIKTLKILKSVASIPTKLYLHKFERFCRENSSQ